MDRQAEHFFCIIDKVLYTLDFEDVIKVCNYFDNAPKYAWVELRIILSHILEFGEIRHDYKYNEFDSFNDHILESELLDHLDIMMLRSMLENNNLFPQISNLIKKVHRISEYELENV